MRKILFVLSLAVVFLFASCGNMFSQDDFTPIGGNIRLLDNDRKLELFSNVVNVIDVGSPGNTAEYIYAHISNVLSSNEKPLFYNDVSMENILRNTISYCNRPIIENLWERGNLVFHTHFHNIGGFIITIEDDRVYFAWLSDETPVISAIRQRYAMIRRILIVEK